MQPVVRALKILTTLAEHRGGLGLQEVSQTLDLPISTAHRLTKVLEGEGFLVRVADTKHFLLGPAVRTLVEATSSNYVRRIAEPEMHRLNRETGETVFLAELVGDEVICFAFLSGTRQVRLFVHLGTAVPLHAGASARVILASLDPSHARELVDRHPLTRWTPHTITDQAELMRHLDVVRQRGYDVCDDEMESSVWAAAAPLTDLTGEVRAALTVVVPLANLDEPDDSASDTRGRRRDQLVSAVVDSAARISRSLGATTP